MTVGARLGAKVRGRFSRRGPGDDQVSILPGEEEEAAVAAGGSAGAPRAAALQEEEEEEGTGCRKVRFAVLPGSYEPLRPPRAPGKRPYGKRLKKYGKVRAQCVRGGRSGDPRHGDPRYGTPGTESEVPGGWRGLGSDSSEGLSECSLSRRLFRTSARLRGGVRACSGSAREGAGAAGGVRTPTLAWIKEHKICLFQMKMTLS